MAAEWRRTDRSFAGLAPHLDAAILAAAPPGACRVIDIGCGAGATSLAVAAARPDATVVGIDLSPALVAVARIRGARPNLSFAVDEATCGAVRHGPADLYVSRHGVMFFADPVAAFAALAAAAAPGARFVFSCFTTRAANRWSADTVAAVGGDGEAVADAAPGPFAFADPARVAGILASAGWDAAPPRRIPFAYRAGEAATSAAAVADAVGFFQRIGPPAALLRALPLPDRPAALAGLARVCERYSTGTAVDFPAEAWIWSAHLPAERNAP